MPVTRFLRVLAWVVLWGGITSCILGDCTWKRHCTITEIGSAQPFLPFDGSMVSSNRPSSAISFHYSYSGGDPLCQPEAIDTQVVDEEDYVRFLQGEPMAGGILHREPYYPGVGPDYWTYMWENDDRALYWRVRPIALGEQAGEWSRFWALFRGDLCLSPRDNSYAPLPVFPMGTVVESQPIVFVWAPSQDSCFPGRVHLQVAEDRGFSRLVEDFRGSPAFGGNWVNIEFGLDTSCRTYFWRVAGTVHDIDGPFSDPGSFVLNLDGACNQPCLAAELDAPALESPADGMHVALNEYSRGIALSWEYPPGCLPDAYQVEVSQDPGFGQGTVVRTTKRPESQKMSWGYTDPLEPLHEYFWRVAARLEDGTLGPYSETRRFLTGDDCPANGLVPPELVSPSDGVVLTSQPLFQWLPGADGCLYPTSYCVVVDDADADTRDVFQCVDGLSSTVPALAGCKTYTWYVTTPHDAPAARSLSRSFSMRCDGDGLFGEASRDLACRQGPSSGWDILGYIVAGESTQVAGKNTAGTWLAVNNLDNPGERCWVPADGISLPEGGDPLRILNEPVACKSGLDEAACAAAGGKWVVPESSAFGRPPPPYCQCP